VWRAAALVCARASVAGCSSGLCARACGGLQLWSVRARVWRAAGIPKTEGSHRLLDRRYLPQIIRGHLMSSIFGPDATYMATF
jgi:hypothetical protein